MSKEFAAANLTLGQMNAIVKKLGGQEGAMRFLRNDSEVVIKTHIIDCDVEPSSFTDWKVEEHQKGGQLQWNAEKVLLYPSMMQTRGRVINSNELRKELQGQNVLNINVLDYLLANPQLIPLEWKNKNVFFWGTKYRSSNGELYVPFLSWRDKQWGCYYDSVGSDYWSSNRPVALLCK